MSTITKPATPTGSESSHDEDPTGVRALLSSLPEPEPMPEHVVDRINASLAAEQAERAARMSESSETSATPLLSRLRARRARVLFATAGAAAAVALVAVVGSTLATVQQATESTVAAGGLPSGVSSASATEEDTRLSAEAAPTVPGPAGPQAAAAPAAGGAVQLRQSEVRYTRADFVKQARILVLAPELFSLRKADPPTSASGDAALSRLPSPGRLGTPAGLQECLRAIGADRAQVVRADVSTYEGKPAAVIVATTNGKTLAYAVGQQCGPKGAFLLHPGTAIPRP